MTALPFLVATFPKADAWIEGTLLKARDCLRHDHPPEPTPGCKQCQYLADLQTLGLVGDAAR